MDENKFPPPPVPWPPKQKAKLGSKQENESVEPDEPVLSEDETALASLFSEDELSRDEEKLPPHTDVHLPGLFSAEYIDPFTVPAAHMLEQGMKIDIASMLEAARLGEEQAAMNNGADTVDPQNIPLAKSKE